MKINMDNKKTSLAVLLKVELQYILEHHSFDVDRENADEYIIWIEMSEMMRDIAREYTEEECESYWYELAYHPDDNSVYVMVVGDANAEHLKIWKRTEELIRIMAKTERGGVKH